MNLTSAPADSDAGRLKAQIEVDGYQPETSMENLLTMIFLSYESPDYKHEECMEYIEASGGYKEFDYYC